MLNVSEKAAKFMMAKPGSFFVIPKKSEVPFETCAKFALVIGDINVLNDLWKKSASLSASESAW